MIAEDWIDGGKDSGDEDEGDRVGLEDQGNGAECRVRITVSTTVTMITA